MPPVSSLALATLALGPRDLYYQISGVLIIVALTVLFALSIRRGPVHQYFVLMRRGLLIFAAFAVWENVRGHSRPPPSCY
jgi:hypothetical protein